MKNHSIRWVAWLGAFTIAAIFLVQLYWLEKAFDVQNRQFIQTVQIALSNATLHMQQQEGSTFQMPVQEISSNYFIVPLKGAIDTSMLRRCLTRELSLRKIDADLEYAIYNSSNHQMMFGEMVHNKNRNKAVKLPVLISGEYYLGISFPGKYSHIAGAMGIWFFSTFLLLIIVAFFTYALWVILRQKKLSELQKDFVNNMAHEFRTPLSTIALSADTLLQHEFVRTSHDLHTITLNVLKETSRLDTQIERILQMAQSKNSSIKLAKEKLDLHALILEICGQYKERFLANNKFIDFNLKAHHPFVFADRMHLYNVVVNLIDNAIKYSDYGKIICIATEQKNEILQMTIKDDGTGISIAHQKKIFDPFYRIPTGNLHNVRGYGLGLNYVKNIVKAHRWNIELISKEKEGTRFNILFNERVSFYKKFA